MTQSWMGEEWDWLKIVVEVKESDHVLQVRDHAHDPIQDHAAEAILDQGVFCNTGQISVLP